MKKREIKYSIVIGAYNESSLIADSLRLIKDYLVEQEIYENTEVVVVTADSPDGTVGIVSEHIQIFDNHQHIKPGVRVGKGRDIGLGVRSAKGEKILFMDADLASPLRHIMPTYDLLDDKDVVLGVRDIRKMHNSWLRSFSSVVSNLIIKIMLWQSIPDTQCGFKAYTKEAAYDIFSRQTIMGWGFDFELIAIAKTRGFKQVQNVVTGWSDPKPAGQGLVGDSQAKAMIQVLKDLIIVRHNIWRGVYK